MQLTFNKDNQLESHFPYDIQLDDAKDNLQLNWQAAFIEQLKKYFSYDRKLDHWLALFHQNDNQISANTFNQSDRDSKPKQLALVYDKLAGKDIASVYFIQDQDGKKPVCFDVLKDDQIVAQISMSREVYLGIMLTFNTLIAQGGQIHKYAFSLAPAKVRI